jgi:cytosine/adenosine deaminase-related metal-dependent hydrolase
MGSAAVLGVDDEVGSLEVGKLADLVVVDLRQPHAWPLFTEGGGNVVEQLVWSINGGDVRYTIVGGRVLLDDGELTTLDLAEIGELVNRESEHLLRSAGVFDHVTRRHRST